MNLRSLWAVIAGVLFIIVVTTIVDVVLHLTGVFPAPGVALTDALALIASSYRVVITIAGAFLTAWLAPSQPLKHALALGVVGTVLGLVGVLLTWGKGMGPSWYPISLMVLAVPECWVGGKIYESTRKTQAA